MCGGGHRNWDILLNGHGNDGLPLEAYFTFIQKGCVVTALLHLYSISLISVSLCLLTTYSFRAVKLLFRL